MKNEKDEILLKKKKIALRFDALKNDYKKTNFQSELKVFGSLIESFSTISSSINLEKGLRPFLISLKLALTGIEKEKSIAGVIGKNMMLLHKNLNDLFIKTFFSDTDIGEKNMIDLFLKTLLILASGFTYILKEKKLTSHEKTKNDKNWPTFEFELILLMIFNTDSLKVFYTNFAKILKVKQERKKTFVELFNGLTFLLVILSFTKGETTPLKTIFSDLNDYLTEAFKNIEKALNISGNNSELNIYIKKSIICLENDDFDNFYNSLKDIFIIMKINTEMYYNELYDLDITTKTLLDCLSQEYKKLTVAIHTV